MGHPATAALAGRDVPRLGLGCLEVGGPFGQGPPDRAAAVALLRRAADEGVKVFDTADSYGPGSSEELLAEALWPYDDVVVVTKGGMLRPGPGEWLPDGRPEQLRHACDGSLQRLRVDALDVYLLHQVDPAVPVEESMGALAALRDEGKVRHVGICNADLAQVERAATVTTLAAVSARLCPAYRRFDPVAAWCGHRGVPFLSFGPFWELDGPLGGVAADVGRAVGAEPTQVVLAWCLRRSPSVVPIPGTTQQAHLLENLAAAPVAFGPADLSPLDRWWASRTGRTPSGHADVP